jgi:hypothetical protein
MPGEGLHALASVNNGPFKPAAIGCPDDSMWFTSTGSAQYAFFSQARDHASNVEDTLHVRRPSPLFQ